MGGVYRRIAPDVFDGTMAPKNQPKRKLQFAKSLAHDHMVKNLQENWSSLSKYFDMLFTALWLFVLALNSVWQF